MTDLAPSPPGTTSRPLQGILAVEVAMLLFVVQDGMMKSMLGDFTVWVLIFARAAVAILVLGPLILALGPPHRLLTPLWPWHLARALLFAVGFSLFYAALPLMGLAEVTTLFFAAPLMTATLAAVFLGETIGPHRLGALLLGFVGVVIAINPAGAGFSWIAALPLLCAAMYATSQIIVRRIGDRESTLTLGLYTVALAGLAVLPLGWAVSQVIDTGAEFRHLRWDWPVPSAPDAARLALLGAVGMAAYVVLSRAYQVASASLVAPFDYTYLPFAALLGYFVWDEVPAWTTLVGMVLIVMSGLYLGYREIRQARRRDGPAPTAEASFAPGNPTAPMTLGADIDR